MMVGMLSDWGMIQMYKLNVLHTTLLKPVEHDELKGKWWDKIIWDGVIGFK